jgi:Tol biopolymer transport system component
MRFSVTLPVLALLVAAQTVPVRPKVRSHICTLDLNGNERIVHTADALFEAPNWSPDGTYLLLNSGGKLWRLPVEGGEPRIVNTGAVSRINNDHGISPDGKWIVISAGGIYILPSTGGAPRQVTTRTPSYYHGWSPDGSTLAYCANRDGNFDIYAISVDGGPERRLTSHPGYDDGPDYSPDGKWIYLNSDRSGSWDIWRIPSDGAGADDARVQRITSDEREDWFPHPSPDGKWIVFLSFERGTKGHPANQQVILRLMEMPGEKPLSAPRIRELSRLFGGQGTINVNSWAPDSKRFAYVRYEIVR